MLVRLFGSLIGALIFTFLAAGTGIVGAFGGIKGLFVFPVLGAVIGFFAAHDISSFWKRWIWPRTRNGKP